MVFMIVVLCAQIMPKVVRATKSHTGSSSDSSVFENEVLIIKNSKSKLTGVYIVHVMYVCVYCVGVSRIASEVIFTNRIALCSNIPQSTESH